MTQVFIKGACLNNGFPNAIAGFGIWWGDKHPDNKSEKFEMDPKRQERAELQAALVAVQQAKKLGLGALIISTDCQFVITCAENMVKWKQVGVCNGNRADLELLANAIKGIDITFEKGTNKVGFKGYDEVCRLARETIKVQSL